MVDAVAGTIHLNGSQSTCSSPLPAARPAEARAGDAVKTSERLGNIGLTGNAAGTPCHLHVELRRSGRLLDPEPRLARWDRYG